MKLTYTNNDKEKGGISLAEAQQAAQNLVELSHLHKELAEKYKKMNEDIKLNCDKLGVDSHFQDDNGTVYKVVVPDMTTVFYKHIDFVRIRRGEEKQGSLSLKAAQELGYEVK